MPHSDPTQKAVPSTGSPFFYRALREIMTEALGQAGNFLLRWYTVTEMQDLGLAGVDPQTGRLADRRPRDSVGNYDDDFVSTTGIPIGVYEQQIAATPFLTTAQACRVMVMFTFQAFWSSFTNETFKVYRQLENDPEDAKVLVKNFSENLFATHNYFEPDSSTEGKNFVFMTGDENPGAGRWSYSIYFDATSAGGAVTEFNKKATWLNEPTYQVVHTPPSS